MMGTPTILIVVFLLICKGFSVLLKTGFWVTVLAGIGVILAAVLIVAVVVGCMPDTLKVVSGLYYLNAIT